MDEEPVIRENKEAEAEDPKHAAKRPAETPPLGFRDFDALPLRPKTSLRRHRLCLHLYSSTSLDLLDAIDHGFENIDRIMLERR